MYRRVADPQHRSARKKHGVAVSDSEIAPFDVRVSSVTSTVPAYTFRSRYQFMRAGRRLGSGRSRSPLLQPKCTELAATRHPASAKAPVRCSGIRLPPRSVECSSQRIPVFS